MSYGPEVIEKLSSKLSQLNNFMPGYGFWYGELGKDIEIAKMILDDKSIADIKAYVLDYYGEIQEEEDDY